MPRRVAHYKWRCPQSLSNAISCAKYTRGNRQKPPVRVPQMCAFLKDAERDSARCRVDLNRFAVRKIVNNRKMVLANFPYERGSLERSQRAGVRVEAARKDISELGRTRS